MNLFVFQMIVPFLVILLNLKNNYFGDAFIIPKVRSFNKVESMVLGCSNQPNNKDSALSIETSFSLAKEYHNFLIKYNILSKDEIDSLCKTYLEENPKSSTVSKWGDIKESNSVKISKLRSNNYVIFENNWNKINKVNKIAKKSEGTTFGSNLKFGLNKFADSISFDEEFKPDDNGPANDLMKKEIKKNLNLRLKFGVNSLKKLFDEIESEGIITVLKNKPLKLDYIDWRKGNITTKVKDQKSCGSCWAFSSVSTLESFMRIKNRSFELLSEQELVDCSTEDYGCRGGFMDTAYDYVISNNGLHSSKDYPYTGKDGNCQADCCKEHNDYIERNNIELPLKKVHRKVPGSKFKEYRFFKSESVEDIKKSLQNGPIAIALDASSFFFRFYESGVIDIPPQYSNGLNHAVMLVGFDKDEDGEHWIIQNSWGPGWGDNGFVKLRIRPGEGTLLCQIYGVYPYS